MQRRNNLMLHPSPTGFRQTFAASPDGRRNLNRAGPDQRWIEALNGGVGAFYTITPEVLELPADAPCPCGSGFIVCQCHRSERASWLSLVCNLYAIRTFAAPSGTGFRLLEGYRYRDSNPGFRTENWLWKAVCGRFVPEKSKEFG
jgi:hypothetical protein